MCPTSGCGSGCNFVIKLPLAGMRPLMIAGILLAAFGVVSLLVRDIHYRGRRTVGESESTRITAPTEGFVRLSPWLGGAALAVGVGLMVKAARR